MELEAGRCRVTLVEMTNASERARAAANLMTQSDNPLPHAAQSSTPARFSPTAGRRRAHDAAAVLALHDHTSSLAAAVARAVVVPPGHPTDTLSLCCSRHPSASRAAIDATPVCREHARMREKWKAGCVARTAETTSTTLAAAAPAALVAWPKLY